MLMDADKNMRKFRHDFRAHALAIRGHAQDCEDTWLMTYVDEMIGASEMDMHQRYTKIAALDAIIQEMFELAARDGIQVTWKGTLGERVDIRIFDLCTIFSNLLLNAIEACRFVDGTRSIESEVYRYEQDTKYHSAENGYRYGIEKSRQEKSWFGSRKCEEGSGNLSWNFDLHF